MKSKPAQQHGFTLIELLVVIAIIGILASVILTSLNSARAKARDAYRASSIAELQSALEMYYDDNGVYPSTGGNGSWKSVGCNCWGAGLGTTSGATGYIPNLAPKYIPSLPTDPNQITGNSAGFLYTSNGTDYFLMAYTSYEGAVPPSKKRPAAPTEQDYAVYSPGATNW